MLYDSQTDFKLIQELHAKSTAYTREERAQLMTKRTIDLVQSIDALRDLEQSVTSTILRLRDNILVYVYAELSETELLGMEAGPLNLYKHHLQITDYDQEKHDTVYRKYHSVAARCREVAEFSILIKFLHVTEPLQLPSLFFEATKGKLQKDISNLPNWPAILNSLNALRNVQGRLREWQESSTTYFCKEELGFYLKKLSLASLIIFNSEAARQSRETQETQDLGIDFKPYLVLPGSERERSIENFSATDYCNAAFRTLITQHLNYRITDVVGDGNCFFRAIVKYLYPNITKQWEDRLSLILRKRLNEGLEKKLRDLGRENDYQYTGFVIADVNDSVTMAKAGVWADNIQLCKLSEAFKCPIK